MVNQTQADECSACWKLEDAGLLSDRQLKNNMLDVYWDKDIRVIEDIAIAGNHYPVMIKNATSNLCNSTCVTCNSGASSAWAPLESKMGIIPVGHFRQSQQDIAQNLNFKEMVSLTLVGGEPLYEKLNFYILEELISAGNTRCFISIVTNGSVVLSDDQKLILDKFKNVNFCISIDGVGEVFEYMRYPLKWDNLIKNLNYFKGLTNNVSVSNTCSNINVMYQLATVSWFNENNLQYNHNLVVNPAHFRPCSLPEKVKSTIMSRCNHQADIVHYLGKPHVIEDDTNFNKMLVEIKKQDAVKGISIIDYLPEFCELVQLT